MPAGTLAYPCGVEVGTLQHHVAGGLVGAASLAAEDTGDAHGFLLVADGKVVGAEGVLLAVEGDKRASLVLVFHYDVVSGHHVGIEAVKRLAVGHHHIVGDVDDVVDRSQPDNLQFVFQPFGRLFHLASCNAHAGIASACLAVLYRHLDGQAVVGHVEVVACGAVQGGVISVGFEPCVEVACHAPVRQCVGAVGGDVYLYQPVALHGVILCC